MSPSDHGTFCQAVSENYRHTISRKIFYLGEFYAGKKGKPFTHYAVALFICGLHLISLSKMWRLQNSCQCK